MAGELPVACGDMPPAMPELEGVEHSFHDLPTGVRVHLASAGPPDAPPVLALHGWPQHWWSWRLVIEELAGEFRAAVPGPARPRLVGPAGRRRLPQAADRRRRDRAARRARARAGAPRRPRLGRLRGHPRRPHRARALLEPARDVDRPPVGADQGRRPQRLPARLPAPARHARSSASAWSATAATCAGCCATAAATAAAGRDEEVDAYVDVAARPGGRARVVEALPRLPRSTTARPARRGSASTMPAKLLIGSREPFRAFAAGFPGEVDVVDGAGPLPPRGDAAGRRRAHPRDVRLITWNVNRRVSVLAEQAAALAGASPTSSRCRR